MFSRLSCKNSPLFYHYFSQQPKSILRNVNLLGGLRPTSEVLPKSQHRIIYDFPYIVLLSAVLRTKRWVSAAGFAISPILYYLDDTHISPFIAIISASCYALIGIGLANVSKNTVGKMYVRKEANIRDVLISSVDDSGKRVDRIHSLEDIINTDFPSTISRKLGFIQLVIQNSDVYYNVNIHSCKIIDEKACDFVFGGGWAYKEVEEKFVDSPKKQLKE